MTTIPSPRLAKIGDTILHPFAEPIQYEHGRALSIQDNDEPGDRLTIARIISARRLRHIGSVLTDGQSTAYVDVNFATLELSLSVDEFWRVLIGEPAMSVLASMIDYDVMSARALRE